MNRAEYSSSLFSRAYVCFFIFFHSTFDPPADKCLLACGELDVRCSTCPQCLETGVRPI